MGSLWPRAAAASLSSGQASKSRLEQLCRIIKPLPCSAAFATVRFFPKMTHCKPFLGEPMIAIFPEIAALALAQDVERLAILVRRYFGGTGIYAPRLDVEALLATFGLKIRRLPEIQHGALLAKDQRGTFEIIALVKTATDQVLERFLLAHLLGHYLLDVQPMIARGEWQVSGFGETICPLQRYVAGGLDFGASATHQARETRADQFAAALLLPRGMLKRALEKIVDPGQAADFFGVSRACLERRKQDLGLSPVAPGNFLAAEKQLGGAPVQGPIEPLTLAPIADGAMPRSYAASTYGATERATRKPTLPPTAVARESAPPLSPPANSAPKANKAKPASQRTAPVDAVRPSNLRGMDRLRELARQLDKSPNSGK